MRISIPLVLASLAAATPAFALSPVEIRLELDRTNTACQNGTATWQQEAECYRQRINNLILQLSAAAPTPAYPGYNPYPSYNPNPYGPHAGPGYGPAPGYNPGPAPVPAGNPIVLKQCHTSFAWGANGDTFYGTEFQAPLNGPSAAENNAKAAIIQECKNRLADAIEYQCAQNVTCPAI
ncbi:MAG TPA: hypothetical protein VL588_11155 [Bdellovibrionota bacterium]|jgi:hypothetical protein|nr:hypothetical protein [Bdellovibrionota bacterium]